MMQVVRDNIKIDLEQGRGVPVLNAEDYPMDDDPQARYCTMEVDTDAIEQVVDADE